MEDPADILDVLGDRENGVQSTLYTCMAYASVAGLIKLIYRRKSRYLLSFRRGQLGNGVTESAACTFKKEMKIGVDPGFNDLRSKLWTKMGVFLPEKNEVNPRCHVLPSHLRQSHDTRGDICNPNIMRIGAPQNS